MSIRAQALLIQLQKQAAIASYKPRERKFPGICYCISTHLQTSLEYWGMGDRPRRPDEKLRQKMQSFWRRFLASCATEDELLYEHCSEEALLEAALRLHCLFVGVGLGVKLTIHLDSARYAAEKLEEVCKTLLEEEERLLLPPPQPTAEIIRFDRWKSSKRLHPR